MEDEKLEIFEKDIYEKYQEYVQQFLDLPFKDLPQAGHLLPKFAAFCEAELIAEQSPATIVPKFFTEIANIQDTETQIELLFWFLQFIERQIVLFDAIEDVAYPKTHDDTAPGSLHNWLEQTPDATRKDLENYCIRLVLTAHPTQFYPAQIIGILQDLTQALASKDHPSINDLLLQMAKTSFANSHQPTPYDEAVFLCQYLDNVFYPTISNTQQILDSKFGALPAAIQLGFWPGGDRDGNPNVTTETTSAVVHTLHQRILSKYLDELEKIKHFLTFKHVWEPLEQIQSRLRATSAQTSLNTPYHSPEEFKDDLLALKITIDEQHGGLYADKISHLISAVTCFGFHYAALDIRQDSLVHTQLIHEILQRLNRYPDYLQQDANTKLAVLSDQLNQPRPDDLPSFPFRSVENDVLTLLQAISTLQTVVGARGLHRYIISHTQAAHHVLEVLLLCYWCGFTINKIPLDIVPLFESIHDLAVSPDIMDTLYQNSTYQTHLNQREKRQTIMLGYSDGTKDGGYVTANWAIYQAKVNLSAVSIAAKINCIFFDGRGGPPARGGGNTHKFYRALASTLAQHELQITLQGQTISTNFGTLASAHYNIDQLYTAGLAHLHQPIAPMPEQQQSLLNELSTLSSKHYQDLIHHPQFLPYLEQITPMNFFGDLNIASRPPRRDQQGPLNLDNLRAITFVSAWSQMKQNVPGYYGFGSAIQTLIADGKEAALKELYQNNLYFHTLVENTMQSLLKNFFPLTHYLKNDPVFGDFWQLLADEATTTESTLLTITNQPYLLAEEPATRASIKLRESIVLPLQVIQQYALIKLHQPNLTESERSTLKKLIQKTLPTNLNASRNSA